jgi:hypothetical protein
MQTTSFTFFPIAIVCLTLAGCGNDTPESSSSGTSADAEIDSCTLLTAAEIEATMGVTPGETERPNPGLNACQWSNPGSPYPVAYVGLSYHSNASWEDYRKYMIDNDYGDPDAVGERIDIGRLGHYQADVASIQVFADSNLLITLNVRGSNKTQILDLTSKAVARLR